MSKALIALAAIGAGALFPNSSAVAAGGRFEVEDGLADQLIADNKAKLAEAESPKGKRVKVRLLVDSALGNCNDLIEVDSSDVKKLESQNLADGSKEAVAYAATLPQNKA